MEEGSSLRPTEGREPASIVPANALCRTIAGIYDRLSPICVGGYAQAYKALDRSYASYLLVYGRVLDLGCGTGANLERVLNLRMPFGSHLGVDQSGVMLAKARAKFAHLPEAGFHQLDLQKDRLPEGPLELMVSTWVFEHLSEACSVVTKAMQRLAPAGLLLLQIR